MNIYAPMTIRNLIFSAQKTAMNDKAQLLVSAFSSYEQLDEATVSEVIHSVNDLHTSRVLVTDPYGYCIYDSFSNGSAAGKLTLYPEVAEALSGSDVVYIRFEHNVFLSKAAMPITAYNRLIGAVYLLENNDDLAALILRLQRTILWISIGLEAVILFYSISFSTIFARRIRKIFDSVQKMHNGDYSIRLPERGHDEIARLGRAFNDLAERLNQSEEVRKQFVSNASHELKTPLASIKLLTDSILQNAMSQSTMEEFVSDIGQEADRLTRLTAKLLELTRLDSKPAETVAPVSVEEVCDRVLRMLTPMARKQLIQLSLDCSPGCTVYCAEDDLYQIVFNLVENGVKYNLDRGAVDIRAQEDETAVRITVADTGVGIPEDAKAHIFERFYRVDKARSRKAGGAGLGLSIVHDMVLRNGGSIRVEDREPNGTVFVVEFPKRTVRGKEGAVV